MKSVPTRLHRVCAAASQMNILNISWDLLPCHLQNGADITGYIIQYSLIPGGEAQNVSNSDMICGQESSGPYRCLIAGRLFISSQTYTFQVAAINNYGVGPFSYPINTTLTTQGMMMHAHHMYYCQLINTWKHEP